MQAQTFRNLHRQKGTDTLPEKRFGLVTNGTMAGISMSGMTTGVLLDGTNVGNRRYDTSASSFSRGGLDVSAASSPKRF